MKRWTIGKRIVVAGALIIALLLVVSGVAVTALRRLEQFAGARLRDDAIPGIVEMSEISSASQRGQIRILTAGNSDDAAKRDQCIADSVKCTSEATAAMKAYEDAITADEDRRNFAELTRRRAAYLSALDTYREHVKTDNVTDASAFLKDKLDPAWSPFRDQMAMMLKWNSDIAVNVALEMVSTARRATLVASAVSVAAVAVAIGLGCFIILGINRALRQVASTLKQASAQVSGASGQVSAASQSLAEGSSEQAASLEETSASLEEIGSMTKRNAENAENARSVAHETSQATDVGTRQMGEMVDAMNAIKSSSDNIAKIIKTIDEIAFQTNILALNAAVEAARAGEAGAGFAVVADEVRALAQRAAQAAKETAEKIDDSIAKSGHGVEISAKVAEGLSQITAKTRQVNDLVVEIASASKEQNQGLGQVSNAVSQMDKVTQSNAGNAEETAAAAEELNAQALALLETVGELMALVGGSEAPSQTAAPSRTARPAAGVTHSSKRPAAGSDFTADARTASSAKRAAPSRSQNHEAMAQAGGSHGHDDSFFKDS